MNQSSSSSSSSPQIRKQPLLRRSLSTPSFIDKCGGGSTAAELCGGTTASCAALWCCCPCSVVNLVFLAVYKLPRGICRRAIRRMRRRRIAKNGIIRSTESSSHFAIHPLESKDDEDSDFNKSDPALCLTDEEEEEEEDEAVIALEAEMWNKFYDGGFWRSYSQAETTSSLKSH